MAMLSTSNQPVTGPRPLGKKRKKKGRGGRRKGVADEDKVTPIEVFTEKSAIRENRQKAFGFKHIQSKSEDFRVGFETAAAWA